MCRDKEKAKRKAAKAIRTIINAARELTAAEGALLKGNTSRKTDAKGEPNES